MHATVCGMWTIRGKRRVADARGVTVPRLLNVACRNSWLLNVARCSLHVAHCTLHVACLLLLLVLLLMACLAVARLRYAFTAAIAAAVAAAIAAAAIAYLRCRTLTKVAAFHLQAAFVAFDFNGYATYHVAQRSQRLDG